MKDMSPEGIPREITNKTPVEIVEESGRILERMPVSIPVKVLAGIHIKFLKKSVREFMAEFLIIPSLEQSWKIF